MSCTPSCDNFWNCINHSAGWDSVAKFKLTTKMRVHPDATEFTEWLLKLGNNNLLTKGTNCTIKRCIKYQLIIVLLIQLLSLCIWCSLWQAHIYWWCNVVSTNDELLKWNKTILDVLPSDCIAYFSSDDIITDNDDEEAQYPIKFLDSLTQCGTPPHKLKVKVGAVVMLFRNLNLHEGLCNGTRLLMCLLLRNSASIHVYMYWCWISNQ